MKFKAPGTISRFLPFHSSAAETSLFEAKLKLFYLMLGANIFKGMIYLYDAIQNHQGDGSWRAVRLMITSALIILLLNRFPKILFIGIHYAIVATILHIYYRTFNRTVGADVVALQAIFMVIICAFYGLSKKWGAIYTIIAFASVLLPHYIPQRWTGLNALPQQLNDLYIVINGVVILMSHIYFHAVLYGNLTESKKLGEKLAELAKSRSNFLSTMSHELRTPLNSVLGIAGLLISDPANAKQKKQLDVLKFSAEHLLILINDILDINKLEAGNFDLEEAPFDLEKLLKGIAEGMAFKIEQKSLSFHVNISPGIKGKTFLGDQARLSQIIFNLVGNAVKFTEAGQVSLRAEVLAREESACKIRIEVSDSGIGIPDHQQEIIFDPFRQASANINRKFGGTGLGLSIVKQIVEKFGSEIHLESEPGKGSVFYFNLTLKEAPHKSKSAPGLADKDEVDLSSLKVLLAEDNLMNIFFMKQLFSKWNIKADIAENGEEALRLLQDKDYDVILMDIQMPVLDGIQTTQRIRALADPVKSSTYIIALTASVSDHFHHGTKTHGMDDYLPKPFQLHDLLELLLKRTNGHLPEAEAEENKDTK